MRLSEYYTGKMKYSCLDNNKKDKSKTYSIHFLLYISSCKNKCVNHAYLKWVNNWLNGW